MGPGPEWPCEWTLAGHTEVVEELAGCEGKLISGSGDNTIQVWDAGWTPPSQGIKAVCLCWW